jgi:undecaprenyl diphosphate synthase
MQSNLHGRLHVGIICDGNGRWATRRGLARTLGHEAGVDAVRRTAEAAPGLGVGTLSMFAFSSDNWRRPEPEVVGMMNILNRYLASETPRLVEKGIRLNIVGRRDRIPPRLADAVAAAEAATADGETLHLRILVDYSGRDAILRAAGEIAGAHHLTREGFARLVTGERAPRDVDLVIRTSGEQRLSDFLIWECAYAEIVFTERMWPDFGAEDLAAALAFFHQRERRFGAAPVKAA